MHNVEVESGLKVAVQALQGFHQVPWPFSYALRQCRLWLGSFDIHHVFREETKLQIGWQLVLIHIKT